MGVIQKQSISGTIYSYIGVILGFVTVGILFPRIFSTEEVGLLRLLVSYSVLFAQFASLGVNTATVKLFPYFRNKEKKHHGYLGIVLIISFAGLLISVLGYLLLQPYFVEHGQERSGLFIAYFYYVIPLIIFTLIFNVFDTYYRVLYNAVKGIVYKEVIQRLLILAVIIAFFLNLIDFHLTVILYVIAIITPTFLLFISLLKSGQFFIKPVIVSDCPTQVAVVYESQIGLIHIANDHNDLANKITELNNNSNYNLLSRNAKQAVLNNYNTIDGNKSLIKLYESFDK